ncbi:hypothetical protein ACSSVQ_000392 [Parvibaculum sp. MBR-TMA-1.3b-4.2]|jgi:hypothetical protein
MEAPQRKPRGFFHVLSVVGNGSGPWLPIIEGSVMDPPRRPQRGHLSAARSLSEGAAGPQRIRKGIKGSAP